MTLYRLVYLAKDRQNPRWQWLASGVPLFFLIKGLMWLVVPALIVFWQ